MKAAITLLRLLASINLPAERAPIEAAVRFGEEDFKREDPDVS